MPVVTASDGTAIVHDDIGSGRPLLLVHGWATHAGFFAPQSDGLAGSFRIVAPDQRGHRRSHADGQSPTIPQLADDLRALLDGLDLTGVLAVGWSMGAMVLWRALLDGAASRIAGMVVVDMAPRVLNGTGWELGLRGGHTRRQTAEVVAAMTAEWPAVSPRIARRIFAEGREAENAARIAWAKGEIARNDPQAMASLWESLTAQDFRADLPRLALPTLVAPGSLSRLYGAGTAAFLVDSLPDARLHAFTRSGHAPHLEEPELFNSVLTAFAAGLPPAGAKPTP